MTSYERERIVVACVIMVEDCLELVATSCSRTAFSLVRGVSHIIHVVIHFVEDVGVDAGGWPGWLGRHGSRICASELLGASTGLDLSLKAL